jgi:DNA-binding SARP family transcriptional activator
VASDLLLRARHCDPCSELTERQLLEVLEQRGAWTDALISFARFRRRIREELGVEPAPETVQLYLGILRAADEGSRVLEVCERALLVRLLSQTPDGNAARDPGREAAVSGAAEGPRSIRASRIQLGLSMVGRTQVVAPV